MIKPSAAQDNKKQKSDGFITWIVVEDIGSVPRHHAVAEVQVRPVTIS